MMAAELAIIAAIGGAVVGTVGVIQSRRAQKSQESAAKASAEFNARAKRDEAARKSAAGRLEADRIRRQRIRLGKSQVAGFAKAGVTSEGTPIDVQIQSAAEEELNAQLAQHNFEIGASKSLSQASVFDFRRRTAGTSGTGTALTAGSTLLGGITQAATIKAKNPDAFKRK